MTDHADILFGDTMAPDTTKIVTQADTEKSWADKLFGDTPKAAPEDGPKSEAKPDAKPDAAKPEAEAKPDDSADPLEGLELDTSYEAAGALRDVAGELGLDKAGVEKLAEVELAHRTEFWERTSDGWRQEIERDSSLNIEGARTVLRRFGDSSLMADLDRFQIGNHPGLVRLLSRIADEYGE